jgi:hypothetical protein
MTTTLNATTSNGLVVTPDNSGNVLLQYNGVAAPAFSAFNAGTQSISASTTTKVIFNGENFDTNNNFDSTTNYRFTPTVAGYYQLSTSVYEQGAGGAFIALTLFKNGASYQELFRTTSTGQATMSGGCLAYANGSTDYFEIYVRSQGATTVLGAGTSDFMGFSGCLLRGA